MAQSFFIALQPINTVQTYAQVFGIISMPIIGITSASSTTGIQNAKLRTIVSHIQRKELSLFSFALFMLYSSHSQLHDTLLALLLETTASIFEIMDELHFTNTTHFYKCFKEHYHMTPKQYRISMKIKLVPQLQNIPNKEKCLSCQAQA